MADRLTDDEIDRIAEIIAPPDLKTFAIRYLAFSQTDVDNIEAKHRINDQQGFKREVLNTWAKKNDHDKKKFKTLLKNLAEKDGLVTWHVVEGILGKDDDVSAPDSTAREANNNTAASVSSAADTRPELADEMLQDLSECITSPSELTKLAVKGLGMPNSRVQTAINDNKRFTPAVLEVLTAWSSKYEEATDAYTALWEALGKVQMNRYRKTLKK